MPAIRCFAASLIIVSVHLVLLAGSPVLGQGANPPHDAAPRADQQAYENASVANIIDLLEQITGKHFIRDGNLAGVPPITVNISGGISKDDAVKLITATLLLNGVAILPVDDHTMKVVTVGTNKNPRSEGLRTYTSEADLPADDQIVTYVMPLDHISPQEAAAIFTQVAPVHTYGAYVPAPSANAVILTENVGVIRELIALKKEIDANNPGPPRPPPPPHPPGNGPHKGGGGPLVLVVLLLLAFFAGYYFARFRLGRKAAQATS